MSYKKKDELQKEISEWDSRCRYGLLGRMQEDCKFWLGLGERGNNFLWAGEPQMQIAYMRALWESFPADAKPVWCTMEQINEYATRMGVQ